MAAGEMTVAVGASRERRNPDMPEYVGRFRIAEKLGGSDASSCGVFRAEDLTLGRMVALKLHRAGVEGMGGSSSDEGDEDPGEADHLRVVDEARAAAIPNHPNIIQIFDVGHIEGFSYIAMELAEQGNLETRSRQGPSPSLAQLCEFGTEIADALAASHRAGVIHGDVKPSNVFLTKDGRCKIGDFGIATIGGRPHRVRGGTDGFAAPELGSAELGWTEPTTASDIFGLGATLRFVRSTIAEPAEARGTEAKGRSELDMLLAGMIAAEAAHRVSTMEDVGARLRDIAAMMRPASQTEGRRSRRGVIWAGVSLAVAASIWTWLAVFDPADIRLSSLRAQPPVTLRPPARCSEGSKLLTLGDAPELMRLAREMPGTPIRFRGTVTVCEVSETGQVCQVLFSPRGRPRPFICAFFPEIFDPMKAKFGGEAGAHMVGRTVELTGKICLYRGIPEVVLDDIDEIRDVTSTCSMPESH